jgi:hypothetical protein
MRTVAAALGIASAVAMPCVAVGADDSGGASDDSFYVSSAEEVAENRDPDTPNPPGGEPVTPTFVLGESACAGAVTVADSDLVGASEVSLCAESHTTTIRTIDLGMVQRAFAELQLPASTLVIQPPDGLTLVNFDTNFYTTSTRPISRTVTLLGQRVTLEATPSTFHWTFGDGERLSTSKPGAPYPDLTVTHNYLRKGTYRPSLATTYTGRYRVGGGPWRTIPGTVTIDGTGQSLRAIEAQPKLVSY